MSVGFTVKALNFHLIILVSFIRKSTQKEHGNSSW